MQIIEALALKFHVHEVDILSWLLAMDLKAAEREIMKEFGQ